MIVALMEYHSSDDRSVASRIFEKGLDYFGNEIDYVLPYLSFLISINDENSTPLVISHFTLKLPILTRCHLFQMLELYSNMSYRTFLLIVLDHYGKVGLVMNINMEI